MQQYNCVVFQLSSQDVQHNGKFFYHLRGCESQKLEESVYANDLRELMNALVDARKRQYIREVTTLPARRYLSEADWVEIPIPDTEFTVFLEEFRSRTKDLPFNME